MRCGESRCGGSGCGAVGRGAVRKGVARWEEGREQWVRNTEAYFHPTYNTHIYVYFVTFRTEQRLAYC